MALMAKQEGWLTSHPSDRRQSPFSGIRLKEGFSHSRIKSAAGKTPVLFRKTMKGSAFLKIVKDHSGFYDPCSTVFSPAFSCSCRWRWGQLSWPSSLFRPVWCNALHDALLLFRNIVQWSLSCGNTGPCLQASAWCLHICPDNSAIYVWSVLSGDFCLLYISGDADSSHKYVCCFCILYSRLCLL